MELFLSKVLPTFVYPLGLAIGLVALAFLVAFTRWRRLLRWLLVLAVLVLWIAAMPVTAHLAAGALESFHPPRPALSQPNADAIVLLGGIAGQALPPRVVPDYAESVDRILEAARLYKAGKAAHIVVAAGNLPWQTATVPEAQLIAAFLGELGVPADAVVLETKSRNTRENALNAAALLGEKGWTSVLLVTSAMHMPRALATFRCAGVTAEPAAADVLASGPAYETLLDFLPNADALALTTSAVKEAIGLVYYRHKGWAC